MFSWLWQRTCCPDCPELKDFLGDTETGGALSSLRDCFMCLKLEDSVHFRLLMDLGHTPIC